MIRPKRIKKVKTENGREILRRLEGYLKSAAVTGEPVEILCGFWEDQQKAITYQELRQAVKDGDISQETLRLWVQDYSVLVATQLSKLWADAARAGPAGQPILDGLAFEFNTQTPGILNWINERGAAFVTASTQEQKNAIAALLTKKMREGHTVDELSRLIRPCIGLTKKDAKAAARLYDSIVANLKKEHLRMKPESIRRKALDATQKYAERKHRARAMTIAQTESAFAYNRGADEGVRQAQAEGYLGIVKKRWSTSGDDAVCEICASLEGMEIDMDAKFDFKGKELFKGQKLLPPAHPRCACAIEYIEVTAPEFPHIPVKPSIMQEDSFKEYTSEEIMNIAAQTEEVASKHIDIPSKWSGNIIIDDSQGRNGKLWNCDILVTHETAPHIILHEQLHARSISYYDELVYIKYRNIEEASVQFVAQEISKAEGIEIVESQYDDMVDALRVIGRRMKDYKTDYDFAKELLHVPLTERLDWMADKMYDSLRGDKDVSVETYISLSDLLDTLY